MSAPPVSTLALRRRTQAERKALALLRGGAIVAQPAGGSPRSRRRRSQSPTPAQARQFAALRRLAVARGFTILLPSSPFLGVDELTLLSWLAGAQRVFGPSPIPAGDASFASLLTRCADLLDGMGLRLSPLTLHAARTREPVNTKEFHA